MNIPKKDKLHKSRIEIGIVMRAFISKKYNIGWYYITI